MTIIDVDALLAILHPLLYSDEGPPFAQTSLLRGAAAFTNANYARAFVREN